MNNSAPTIKKFNFDTEFRGRRDLLSEEAKARQRVSMTHEEIDEMCAKACEEGQHSALVRAAEKNAAAVEVCGRVLREVMGQCEQEIELVRAEATRVAVAVARKLAGAALAAAPEVEIESAFREAVRQAAGEGRLVLRASKPVVDALTPRLTEIAQEEGFVGRVDIKADPKLATPDCRIEWSGGGLERRLAEIESAIDELIEQRFSGNAERMKG